MAVTTNPSVPYVPGTTYNPSTGMAPSTYGLTPDAQSLNDIAVKQSQQNLTNSQQSQQALMGLYSGLQGSGYTPPSGYGAPGGAPLGGAAQVGPMQMPDQSAANQAAYGQARDTAGKTGASALSGLQESLASRGMLGSGIEARGMEQLAENAQGQIGQVTRDQAVNNAALAQKTAEENYSGGITQRAQDLGQQATLRGQDIGQQTAYRGQDVQGQEAAAQRNQNILLGLVNAGNRPPVPTTIY